MARKDQVKRLQKELRRLKKRSLSQRDAWEIIGGTVYRRMAIEWFRRGLGLSKKGGGPDYEPWRKLASRAYIRKKEREGRTTKLVAEGTFKESYFYEPNSDHCLVGNRDFEKAGWLEGMGFEILGLEDDIKEMANKIITDFIWTK